MNFSAATTKPRRAMLCLNRRGKFIKFLFVDAANFQSQFVASDLDCALSGRNGFFYFRNRTNLSPVARSEHVLRQPFVLRCRHAAILWRQFRDCHGDVGWQIVAVAEEVFCLLLTLHLPQKRSYLHPPECSSNI